MASETMKAVRMEKTGGPEVLEVVRVPVPTPGAGQVRVKVEAAGMNYSDIMIRQGMYIDAMKLPYFVGREFCGTVDAVGHGADMWKTGQRVVGSIPGGAFAEYLTAPAATLMPCPDGLSAEQGAALLIQGITALHCLEDFGRLQPGETVLVHAGAGGVGTLAIQIARTLGAGKVIGTASSEAKCKVIEGLGGTAINYTEGDWVKDVLAATGGRGADVILESVGGDVALRSYKEALADFGRMVIYGVAGGQIVQLDNREILVSNKTLSGYFLGAYFPKYLDKVAAATMKLAGMVLEGKVKPVIGQSFALDDVAAAFDHMQQRKSTGKVIIKP